jgi:hypothetical protein
VFIERAADVNREAVGFLKAREPQEREPKEGPMKDGPRFEKLKARLRGPSRALRGRAEKLLGRILR